MGDATRGVVVRFPAVGCGHFEQGRCLYEERLNPGYHTAWRCLVLARWESVYDEFLDRAENFGLTETELGQLWSRRFERLAEESVPCPDVRAGDAESMPECRHLLEEICLLRLPECNGQCDHFRLRKRLIPLEPDMTLYFPHLHPDLLTDDQRQALPEGVRFLDPGLAKPDSPDHVLPETAPFDRRLARAILADTLRFGESVAAPRDLAVQGLLQRAEALSLESERLVLASVEGAVAGASTQPDALPEPLLAARQQAQTLLLLAWNLEERILDLRSIDKGLRSSWTRLGESLCPTGDAEAALAAQDNVEQDNAEADAEVGGQADCHSLALGTMLSGMTPPDAYGESLPWRRILEAFVALAPGVALVTADAAIVSTLREVGLPESQGAFLAPAWKLAGLDRCPLARPWLETEVRLTCVSTPQGAA